MGYLSCRAQSSVVTCRSLSSTATASASSSASVSSSHHHHPKAKPAGAVTANNDTPPPTTITTEAAADDSRHRRRAHNIRQFTYRELEAATCNFSDNTLLGRGSHGSVYKAVLRPSGRLVAVKRPSRLHHRHRGGGGSTGATISSSRRLERNEVENEIDILSRIHGPRLVNLVGVSTYDGGGGGGCVDDTVASAAASSSSITTTTSSSPFKRERLLVVEYMPNGTLYDLLHSNPRPPGWGRRLRLALQTAKAIDALHSCDPPIIHRDVKSANVLIDAGFNARLADFGLALRADGNGKGGLSSSVRSTPPAGTLGYLDPGYVTPENLSTKTDVFSFGILLLEIVSGRKAIDVAHSPPSVVEWAVPLLRRGKVLSLYDPRIAPPKDPAARRQLASLAAGCVRSSRERRPSMEEVVDRLKLLSKTVPSKSWTTSLSAGNPCLMVETADQTHHSKPNPTDLDGYPNSSLVDRCMSPNDEPEEKLEEEMPVGAKKPPSSAKAVHPLRKARRVFSDGPPSSSSRNLMDLMMAPDEETLKVIGSCHQRSIISKARTLHLSRDYNDRDSNLQLRRNQSVRGEHDVFLKLDGVGDLDGRAIIQAAEPL